jgi:PAS domain S-box-containing protein
VVVDANAQYAIHTGLPRTGVIGRRGSTLFGSPEAPYLRECSAAVAGRARVRFDMYSARLQRHFSLHVIPVSPSSFGMVLSDIALRNSHEEALETGRLAQRALLDNQPHLAWLKDVEGRFLAVNKVFAEACGLSLPEALVGKSDLDVWPRELAEAYRADDAAVMASGRQKAVEEPIASVDGTRWFETYKSPVFASDGSIVGTTGVARDVTARKNAMTMPHLDGEACFLALRELNPNARIVMTSGYSEQEVVAHFVGKGLAGFVQKPYKADLFLGKIRDILHGSP